MSIEIAITIRLRLLSHESIIALNRMRLINRSFRDNSASTIYRNSINTIHSIRDNETLNILNAINSFINTMLINFINLSLRFSQAQSNWIHRNLDFRSSIQNNKASSLSSRNHFHRVSIKTTIAKNTIDEIHWEERETIKVEIFIIRVKLKKLTLTRLRKINLLWKILETIKISIRNQNS